MDATDEQHQGIYQDTERLPKSTINHIPDEVLLEIFDSYRHATADSYDLWRKKHAWLILAHVCRKWRAIVFASSSRLDLCIAVGPEKPGHIKTILSGHLPILIDYECMFGEITGSALWRMRAALRHQDRVREIVFGGTNAWFKELFKATNFSYPALESLELHFLNDEQPKIPDTFLRGPDLSDLHLRRLEVNHVPLTSISGFLLSATALTDFSLTIDTTLSPSLETPLLFACLQGMPCLRNLDLTISYHLLGSPAHWKPETPGDIIPLPKLTRFHYEGLIIFLDALVAGISAPSLQDVDIQPVPVIWPPTVHLPRFLNEIKEHYHAVDVIFGEWRLHLSLLAQSEYFGHRGSRFYFESRWRPPDLLMRIYNAFSTRLTAVEELRVTIDKTADKNLKLFSWRRFYGQFPSVKVLRTGGKNNHGIAQTLLQDHGEPDDLAFLPALEEIDLGKTMATLESERESQLAAFQPFVSVREQEGCPVKVFFSP